MAKEKTTATEEKPVARKPREKKPENPQKLTYEQLEQLASQYYSQCKALNEALKDAENRLKNANEQIEIFRTNEFWIRIDWLWKIITLEGGDEVFSEEFLKEAAREFELRMAPQTLKSTPEKEE